MKSIFSLNRKPWLFTFLLIIFWVICNILVVIALTLILQLNDYTQVPTPWPTLLANILTIFIVAPFVLGFPGKEHTYGDYLSEIRLTKMQPFLRLILLGLSCYLINALSQAAGVLVYRLVEGLPVDGSFIRSSFVLANELPPRSPSWLLSTHPLLKKLSGAALSWQHSCASMTSAKPSSSAPYLLAHCIFSQPSTVIHRSGR